MEKKLKIGDIVDYHSIIGGPITSKNHKIIKIIKNSFEYGIDIAWITGKQSCVSLKALSLAKKINKKLKRE